MVFLTGSPPQQVVRQPQLLVTDGSGVPGSGPNQLQLPQRPTPPGGLPNLPKPVPSQAAAHKPKIIPGKGIYRMRILNIDHCGTSDILL